MCVECMHVVATYCIDMWERYTGCAIKVNVVKIAVTFRVNCITCR